MASSRSPLANRAPVLVVNQKAERRHGREAQLANVAAAKAVSDIIRTTLGPRAMLKMILDPMGGIVMTNDGNCILREVDVTHPAAKSMIELSRTQDEQVGDGTTSVIILAGEVLHVAIPFLERNIHPTIITLGYARALQEIKDILEQLSRKLDLTDDKQVLSIVQAAIGTKFTSAFGDIIPKMALDAVRCVTVDRGDGKKDIDTKRYARVIRIPGGQLKDSCVMAGVMFDKDVLYPSKMRRRIENPRVLLIDSGLEYKKGESQTNIEIQKESDFEKYLQIEEEYVKELCDHIVSLKVDIVLTEKACVDIATHYLAQAGVTVIRRIKKQDNNRLSRVTGATIGHDVLGMKESDVGTKCGLYIVRQIGDTYYSYFEECKDNKACTIVLRGASDDVLREVHRNLDDAMAVTRNIFLNPAVVPGGGAIEMAVSKELQERASKLSGTAKLPFLAIADALEVIPRTLISNCGGQVMRIVTALRAKHQEEGCSTWGVDGSTGKLVDMNELNVWEPIVVKEQTLKTAIESACMLLRIDDVLSGITSRELEQQVARGGGRG